MSKTNRPKSLNIKHYVMAPVCCVHISVTSLETEENKLRVLNNSIKKTFKNYISVNIGKWSHEKRFETFTI
jgi:hypothetical protein